MNVSNPQLPLDPGAAAGAPFRFLAGVRAALEGVRGVLAEPRLRGLALVPMAVHLLLLAGLLGAGMKWGVAPLAGTLEGLFGASAPHWLSWLARGLAWALLLLGVLLGTVVVGNVVCDPFYDLLSGRTEALLLGRAVDEGMTALSITAGILKEGVATLVRLCIWAPGAILLFALSLTPAAVVSAPLSFAWTALFAAWEFLSRSFGRHGLGSRARLRVLSSHKALVLGFGAAAVVLSFVPFTAPFLVVGSTRLFLALAARGQVPSLLQEADRQEVLAVLAGWGRTRGRRRRGRSGGG